MASTTTLLPPENDPQKRRTEQQRRLEEQRLQEIRRREEERARLASDLGEIRAALASLPLEIFNWARHRLQDVAVRIVDDLKAAILDKARPMSFEDISGLGVPTADIERDCETLKEQIEPDGLNGSHPCREISPGVVVPIDRSGAMASSHQLPEMRWLSNTEAVNAFGRELVPFLIQRVAASAYFPMRGIAGGMSPTPLMLPVTVSAITLGARVSYSPSYFVNYQTLASPTSPVYGVLLPGRYIFMISTAGSKQYDQVLFNVPPDLTIPLNV
jgi:hypothetical protein